MSDYTEVEDLKQIRERQADVASDIDEIINRSATHAEAHDIWMIWKQAEQIVREIDEILKRCEREVQTDTEREETEAEKQPGKIFCPPS